MSSEARARQCLARQLLAEFADATGLTGNAAPRRYLWTDAFAVCNFLGQHRETGEGRDLDLALRLVDQVHHVLGRHRPDDSRQGWISGLPRDEGERHPTRGGLRIGKALPERRPDEAFDDRLEWDRDGQYFHYLTQWMHALARVSEETGQAVFRDWAVELAKTAQARFTHGGAAAGARRLAWKMSIDLSRPLVPSMGQHDPLDAWLTYLELQAGAPPRPDLDREIAEAATLCGRGQWATDDALGIGGLLTGVFRSARLVATQGAAPAALLERLVEASRISLEAYSGGNSLARPADSRLAFRELGLSIGLHALETIESSPAIDGGVRGAVAGLLRHRALAARIDDFWSEPAHRQPDSWTDHREINAVMLATSLSPGGYLGPV